MCVCFLSVLACLKVHISSKCTQKARERSQKGAQNVKFGALAAENFSSSSINGLGRLSA